MKDFQIVEPCRKSGSCSRSPDTWPALLIVSVCWSPSGRLRAQRHHRSEGRAAARLARETTHMSFVHLSTVCKPFRRGVYLNSM